MRQGLYIGQVAKETGLSIDTIRFYEREGLLTRLARSDGGFRVFDPNILRDLDFIRRAQGLGFSLQEIRELLVLRRSQSLGCSHVQRLLDQHLAVVEDKIKELLSLQTELKTALRSAGASQNTLPVERSSLVRSWRTCSVGMVTRRLRNDEDCISKVAPGGGTRGFNRSSAAIAGHCCGSRVHGPEAARLRFLGSPTIRVNGVDIDPVARSSTEYGLKCRVYRAGERFVGVPPRELLEHAIQEARNGQDCCAPDS
jgi:DNA-binding transcriptional MerR regulator